MQIYGEERGRLTGVVGQRRHARSSGVLRLMHWLRLRQRTKVDGGGGARALEAL